MSSARLTCTGSLVNTNFLCEAVWLRPTGQSQSEPALRSLLIDLSFPESDSGGDRTCLGSRLLLPGAFTARQLLLRALHYWGLDKYHSLLLPSGDNEGLLQVMACTCGPVCLHASRVFSVFPQYLHPPHRSACWCMTADVRQLWHVLPLWFTKKKKRVCEQARSLILKMNWGRIIQ